MARNRRPAAAPVLSSTWAPGRGPLMGPPGRGPPGRGAAKRIRVRLRTTRSRNTRCCSRTTRSRNTRCCSRTTRSRNTRNARDHQVEEHEEREDHQVEERHPWALVADVRTRRWLFTPGIFSASPSSPWVGDVPQIFHFNAEYYHFSMPRDCL